MWPRSVAARRAYGPEHSELAAMLSPYATVLDRAGKTEQADSTYLRVLAMRRKLLGEEHPEYAWTMFNYADFLLTHKRYPEAVEWSRKVLKLRGRTLARHAHGGIDGDGRIGTCARSDGLARSGREVPPRESGAAH